MQRYILGRLFQSVAIIIVIVLLVFFMGRLTGDPIELFAPEDASQEDIDRIRAYHGLDLPVHQQLLRFAAGAAKGEFGRSTTQTTAGAMDLVIERLPNTVRLGILAIIIALLIALPVGIISAVKRDTIVDRVGKLFAVTGQGMPDFWLGLMLIMGISFYLSGYLDMQILPIAGSGTWKHIVLPAVTVGWSISAPIMRVARSSMLNVMDSEYISFARSKGLSNKDVITKHALRNAAIPVVTVTAIYTAAILRGTVVVETVFAWPGVGRLAVQSAFDRDFPVLQATILFMAVVFVGINFLVDVAYAYIDPRIRYR